MSTNNELELPDTNVIIRDGKVYAITETELPSSGLLKEIKEFYRSAYQTVKNHIADEEFDKYEAERVKQMNHINAVIERHKAIIPTNMFNKPVMHFNGSLCEVRWVRYAPKVIVSDAYRLIRTFSTSYTDVDGIEKRKARPDYTKVFDFVKNEPHDARIVITLSQTLLDFWMIFCYSAKMNLIYTPFNTTFHTMLSDRHLCTGNFEGSDFWNSPDFNNLINQVNCFSLASDSIVISAPLRQEIFWHALLKDNLVVDIRKEVLWRA